MIVFRWTRVAKPGRMGELVTLLKELAQSEPESTIRIYTSNLGPARQIVWEQEPESQAACAWPFHYVVVGPF